MNLLERIEKFLNRKADKRKQERNQEITKMILELNDSGISQSIIERDRLIALGENDYDCKKRKGSKSSNKYRENDDDDNDDYFGRSGGGCSNDD